MVYCAAEDSTEYTAGYPAVYLPEKQMYAASLVSLDEGKHYDITAIVKKDGREVGRGSVSAETLSSDVSIAESYAASEFVQADGCMYLSGLNGNRDGYICIKGNGNTVIDAEENAKQCVRIENCSYIILENITIKGGAVYGIYADPSVSHIIIRNCDISGWGRTGTVQAVVYNDDGSVATVKIVDKDGEYINFDSGINLTGVSDVLVENCQIHTPRGNSTPWRGSRDGVSWTFSHPWGSDGILVRGERIVIRYNDIVGSEEHRLNDCIEGYGNFSNTGGFAADCDIYGNYLAFAEDDAIELDGGGRNVRMFGNRIVASRTAVSVVPNSYGPIYLFNNLVHDMRDSTGRVEFFVKIGNEKYWGLGVTHIFHNTFYAQTGTKGIVSIGGDSAPTYYNAVTRNNIILNQGEGIYSLLNVENEDSRSSFDYDLIYNYSGTTLISLKAGSAKEENGIFAAPLFEDVSNGKYMLKSKSKGAGAAVRLDGFGFEGSDVGAYSNGTEVLPLRLHCVTADKEYVRMKKNSSEEITITSKENKTVKFEIVRCTPEEESHVSLNRTSGKLMAGASLKLVLTTDNYSLSKTYADEVFLIKFENGMTLPIGVRLS